MSRNTVSDFVNYADPTIGRKWNGKKIPFSDVYEAYIDGQLDIPADKWDDFFATRHETMSFRLTDSHIRWAFTNFLPEVTIHSKSQDARIVGEHYNRGNDFFEWCLGEAMVYTAASFETPDMPLAQAQYRKIDRACNKLQLKPGETLLDIGCGWGTFVARAAKEFGAKTYGVTLAQEQVNFGTERIAQYGVADRAKVEVCDYRNVTGQFDKIVSLEMVEHVGIKNLVGYYQKVHELLKDDGLFVIQWTGIRNLYNPQNPLSALTLRPEDLIWGLFMNRHIFPGADASLPLSHYVLTLRHWRDIWQSNRENVIKSYGERWYRLWYFFLHWSALIGEQGSAFTYQMLMHKNSDSFNRKAVQFGSGKHWR
jgi:cyclopropane fatty-acyl-phospholipid synthase-like methyltransferase